MSDFLSFSLVTFSAVFFVMDPLGLLPLFVAMTADDSDEKRRRTAKRATIFSFFLLAAFTMFGSVIFKAFGITLGAFKIAGGFLLLLMAMDMLRAQPSRTRSSPEEAIEGSAKEDVAIVPLAMPLLAGPGAIATVMVLAGRGGTFWHTIPVILSVGITCVITYLLLSMAPMINRIFGASGIGVLERIMGLLLAAIAVQFMADGLIEVLGLPGRSS